MQLPCVDGIQGKAPSRPPGRARTRGESRRPRTRGIGPDGLGGRSPRRPTHGRGCSRPGTRLPGLNTWASTRPSLTPGRTTATPHPGPFGPLPSSGAPGSSFLPEKTQIEFACAGPAVGFPVPVISPANAAPALAPVTANAESRAASVNFLGAISILRSEESIPDERRYSLRWPCVNRLSPLRLPRERSTAILRQDRVLGDRACAPLPAPARLGKPGEHRSAKRRKLRQKLPRV